MAEDEQLDEDAAKATNIQPGEAVVWLRMCDADLERYGGPEWVGFDVGVLFNSPSSVLEELEDEIPIPLANLIFLVPELKARATRAVLFVARRMAGVREKWEDFDPVTMQVKRRSQPEASGATTGGRGKPRRRAKPASPRSSAAARSAKSSTTSAQS